MVNNVQAALNLIDQNIANLNGTRQSHMELQEAVAILQNLIDKTIENAKNPKTVENNKTTPETAAVDKPKTEKKKV